MTITTKQLPLMHSKTVHNAVKLSAPQNSTKKTPFKVNLVNLFDKLNNNLFNGDLKGIAARWSSDIESHTAVSLGKKATLNDTTEIFLSESLLSKCTRKHIIESLLVISISIKSIFKINPSPINKMSEFTLYLQYEMIYLYITSKLSKITEEDEKAEYLQALMDFAMNYVNKTAGLNLTFNYTLRAHKTIKSSTNWIDVDDEVVVNQLNDTIICISDSDDDSDFEDIRENLSFEDQKIVSKTITLMDLGHSTIDCCCCHNYSADFKKYFAETNFRIILSGETASIACPCCKKIVEENGLNNHLNTCIAFRN